MDSLNPNAEKNFQEYNPFLNKKKSATFNQEQLSFLKTLIDQGWSVSRICKTYNLNSKNIKRRIANNDWVDHKKDREHALTQKELICMRDELEDGALPEDVAKKFNVSLSCVLNRQSKNKWEKRTTRGRSKYSFDESFFDDIDCEKKAYWLGFMMADGFITSKREREKRGVETQCFGITLSSKDIEHLEKFKKDLNSNHPIYTHKNYKSQFSGTETSRLMISSQHTVDSLKKWGVVENKTFFCKMPDIEEKLKPVFIRGYSDGDGSIIILKDYRFSWEMTGTKELLTSILSYLGKEDLKLYQRWPERENNNYSITIFGRNQVINLLDIIYENATVYLERKYQKYLEMKKWKEEHKEYKYRQGYKYAETRGKIG